MCQENIVKIIYRQRFYKPPSRLNLLRPLRGGGIIKPKLASRDATCIGPTEESVFWLFRDVAPPRYEPATADPLKYPP